MNESLIKPDQHWIIWFFLFLIAFLGFSLEKTKIGSKISGAMLSIFFGFLASNLGLLPVEAQAYDMTWGYLVPLAIPLLLFNADMRKIFREAGPTLLAFIFGGVGSVLGTIIAFNLFHFGEETWKIAGIFCATYVGGSMNYVAVAQALQLQSADLLTAGIAADNLMMTAYFFILFSIPGIAVFRKLYPERSDISVSATDSVQQANDEFSIRDILVNLTLALGFGAISFQIEHWIHLKGSAILILTALTVFSASIFPQFFGKLKGNHALGVLFMQIFFAVIGASANIKMVLKVGPLLFLFAAVILSVHLVVVLLLGKLFKLDLREILIASNANMGGPTTAAAMAVAKKWDHLILPAILSGTFGYAIANFVGVFVANWLH